MTERYFEDYPVGSRAEYGPIEVTEAEIVAFARRYDPQPFHVDPAAAGASPYGGLIASGWHTCALMMRALADGYFCAASSLGSPGIDELRWPAPVRPGDRLGVRTEVLDARRSRSKADRGVIRTRVAVSNQTGAVVLELVAINLVRTRPAG